MSFIQKEFTTPLPLPTGDTSQGNGPWKLLSPGIWELHLNGSDERKSVFQWWEPNTETSPERISHSFIEEVCFLKGGLEDLYLSESWGVGAYAFRLPGMLHGPYKASKDGCLMFVKISPAVDNNLKVGMT
ncbi:hypothetical protein N7528_001917 [Penicillium herquei]|nr:hypothetical protein N7528_001917 [Penicillium herquei]